MPNNTLIEIATALRVLGTGSSEEVIEQVRLKNTDASEYLEKVLELFPTSIIRVVYDTVMALTDPTDKEHIPGDKRLRQQTSSAGKDPRSFREAAKILDTISEAIPSHSELDERLTSALQLLNDKKVLSLQALRKIARFLVAIRSRPGAVDVDNSGSLVIADERIQLSELKTLAAWLDKHSDLWGIQASEHSKRPHLVEQFGALEKKRLCVDLVLKEPALVLLPSRSTTPRWIRVDPLPDNLVHPQALAELQHRKQVSGTPHPRAKEAAKVLWAGMHIVNTVLDDQWFQANMLPVFEFHPEHRNIALFNPKTGTIHVWGGPLSPWAVVHEMAHLLDYQLGNGTNMASEIDGHPLNAFTDAIRPIYRECAEKRARALFDSMMKRAVQPAMLKKMKKGPVPLKDVIDAMDWIPADRKNSVAHSVSLEESLTLPMVETMLGDKIPEEGVINGPFQVLSSIQETLVLPPDAEPQVDIEAMWVPFLHQQLQYLLSNRELFARYFDQYARMLFSQLGKPYGPRVRPGDAPDTAIAQQSGNFLTALKEAQINDWTRDLHDASEREGENILVSGVLTLGMLAVGAGFTS